MRMADIPSPERFVITLTTPVHFGPRMASSRWGDAKPVVVAARGVGSGPHFASSLHRLWHKERVVYADTGGK